MAQVQQVQVNHTPTAAESLANMHALFNTQSRGGLHYDHLPNDTKAVLCYAARLTKNHPTMKLADMDDLDRAKLHRAINSLVAKLQPLMSCSLSEFH
jgi:hypothetical protein